MTPPKESLVSPGAPLGVPDLSIEPGDHICALYRGVAERDGVLLPYIRAGLESGDKCLAVVDATGPEHLLDRLRHEIDVDACLACEQLDVMSSDDAYLRTGSFASEEMLAFWDAYASAALDEDRFSFIRIAGEAAWALRDQHTTDELIRYESDLNRFTGRYPQAVLCLYDLTRFGGDILVDLMRTHPKLLLGGLVLDNPHYLSPDEFADLQE
jgi:MEDS: MEthanogen/methylotroph, DcmR Sensory domain